MEIRQFKISKGTFMEMAILLGINCCFLVLSFSMLIRTQEYFMLVLLAVLVLDQFRVTTKKIMTKIIICQEGILIKGVFKEILFKWDDITLIEYTVQDDKKNNFWVYTNRAKAEQVNVSEIEDTETLLDLIYEHVDQVRIQEKVVQPKVKIAFPLIIFSCYLLALLFWPVLFVERYFTIGVVSGICLGIYLLTDVKRILQGKKHWLGHSWLVMGLFVLPIFLSSKFGENLKIGTMIINHFSGFFLGLLAVNMPGRRLAKSWEKDRAN